jgi:hypothetical protein
LIITNEELKKVNINPECLKPGSILMVQDYEFLKLYIQDRMIEAGFKPDRKVIRIDSPCNYYIEYIQKEPEDNGILEVDYPKWLKNLIKYF